jgi:ORF6N domain
MASSSEKSGVIAANPGTGSIESMIESQVLEIRGHRVLLAQQLALLYGVETKVLNQAVQRNIERFPKDFMFRLEREDLAALRSQTVTLNAQVVDSKEVSKAIGLATERGSNAKYLPYAFTEQGVAMLSSVLKSERAIAVNIEIMRTFVKLRNMLSEHVDLKRKLTQLEKKYDDNFRVVFDAIHQLMDSPKPSPYSNSKIGFVKDKQKK